MDEFKDLEFTASDFTAAPTSNAAAMAAWTNRKLIRKLEKASVVYASPYLPLQWHEQPSQTDTRKARLICIEEMK